MWGVIQNVLIISILKLQKMHVHLISITAGMRGGHRAQFLEFRLFGGVMEYELPADCSHSHALGQWNCVNNVHPHWLSWSLAFLSANESLRTSMLLASISSYHIGTGDGSATSALQSSYTVLCCSRLLGTIFHPVVF